MGYFGYKINNWIFELRPGYFQGIAELINIIFLINMSADIKFSRYAFKLFYQQSDEAMALAQLTAVGTTPQPPARSCWRVTAGKTPASRAALPTAQADGQAVPTPHPLPSV